MDLDSGVLRQALGSAQEQEKITTIPTGVPQLDIQIGGGFTLGRPVSIFGKGGTGKSSLLYNFLDVVAKLGGVPLLLDSEYNYTVERARELGLVHLIEKLILFQDISLEGFYAQFMQILTALSKTPGYRFGALGIDSFSSLLSQAEIASGKPGVSIHARLASFFFRNSLSLLPKFNLTLIFVSQERTKIGSFQFASQSSPTYLSQASIYANAFQEFRMVRVGTIKSGGSSVGSKLRVKVTKNKIAPPFREIDLDYYFSIGYDKARAILDGLVSAGMASKTKGWYNVNGTKLQPGSLRGNPELMDTLETALYEVIQNTNLNDVEIPDEDIDNICVAPAEDSDIIQPEDEMPLEDETSLEGGEEEV